jgi:hypothetical protein
MIEDPDKVYWWANDVIVGATDNCEGHKIIE